jgi:bifunctional DNA-binding transcriptional regulator/antitoxin component of YhaV-PrlF toxin-antitoxin module
MVLMVEVVEMDVSGRIVIPKNVRRELKIARVTKFILANRGEGQLLLQKLDVDEIARRLKDELAGKDIDRIVKSVRKEINRKIKAQYSDLLT